jgi:hypothetical protein
MRKAFLAVIFVFIVVFASSVTPVSAQAPARYYAGGHWHSTTNYNYGTEGIKGYDNVTNQTVVDWAVFIWEGAMMYGWRQHDTVPWWMQAGYYDCVYSDNSWLPSTNNIPVWYVEWRIPTDWGYTIYAATTYGSALSYLEGEYIVYGYYGPGYKKTWRAQIRGYTGSSWVTIATKDVYPGSYAGITGYIDAESECLSALNPPQNTLNVPFFSLYYKLYGQYQPWDALQVAWQNPYHVTTTPGVPTAFTTWGP